MSKEKGCKCCKQIWYEDMLDKKWKLCPNCYEYCKPLIDDLKIKDKKITDLEAKLAEKDKEIKNLVIAHFESEINKPVLTTTQMINQDKISFAVEQLEKVKNKIESKVESIYKILDDLNIKIVGESTSRELNAYEEIAKDIDNQINELKGEMK